MIYLIDRGTYAKSLLKTAIIFYDTIVIVGPNHWADSIAEEVRAGTSLKQNTIRERIRGLEELGHDLEDIIYPDEVLSFLELYLSKDEIGIDHNMLKESIEAVRRDRENWSQELIHHPLFKLFAATKFGYPYHGSSDELEKISKYFTDRNGHTNVSVSWELEVTLPPMENASYESVIEFSNSAFLERFREFIHRHHSGTSEEKEIREEIESSLWQVIGFQKPSKNGSLWSRVAAAAPVPVPVPLPNPYGVYKEWKDGKKENKLFKEFGWLWFIQEAREGTKSFNEGKFD